MFVFVSTFWDHLGFMVKKCILCCVGDNHILLIEANCVSCGSRGLYYNILVMLTIIFLSLSFQMYADRVVLIEYFLYEKESLWSYILRRFPPLLLYSILLNCLSLSWSYIYINIYRPIDIMVRVFTTGPRDQSSILVRVIQKTPKIVLDTSLLNTQNYK